MMQKVVQWMSLGLSHVLGLGPYVALATMLPGGAVAAALAWLYQHRLPHAERRA